MRIPVVVVQPDSHVPGGGIDSRIALQFQPRHRESFLVRIYAGMDEFRVFFENNFVFVFIVSITEIGRVRSVERGAALDAYERCAIELAK